MPNHLIIGSGNLGNDLAMALHERGEHHWLVGRKWQEVLRDQEFDTVWCTAGAGGPSDDIDQTLRQIEANVLLAAELCRRAPPTTRLVFFSTHYLINDPRGAMSRYAMTKRMMEEIAMGRPCTTVYRIGSLYGRYHRHKTFPGKLLERLKDGNKVDLPLNEVTPTPTAWLAKGLVDLRDHPSVIMPLGPRGGCTVAEWGHNVAKLIGKAELIDVGGHDLKYPEDSKGGIHYGPDWLTLWEEHGPAVYRC